MKRTDAWSDQEFDALPATLTLRMIRLRVAAKGFRTQTVVLVTTLLDPVAYPGDALRELYGERWNVELHFHQIKTMLAMDVLRCKSPELIQREVALHRIAYNLVRCIMQRSAHLHHVPLERISFKGSLDALRHWSAVIAAAGDTPRKQDQLIVQDACGHKGDLVPERPGTQRAARQETKAENRPVAHRPPRHKIGNLPRRNRPQKITPKTSLS